MPKIQESAENYLETILVLKERNGTVRSVDIAAEMGFSKPSVSVAMKNLRENGYVEMDGNGYLSLTDKGRVIAETMYEGVRYVEGKNRTNKESSHGILFCRGCFFECVVQVCVTVRKTISQDT